jgi:DNA polymerase
MNASNESAQKRYSDLVDKVTEYVECLRDEGLETVSMDPKSLRAGPAPAVTAAPFASNPEPDRQPQEEPMTDLQQIADKVAVCTLCPLHETRNKTVPGQGNTNPDIAFIGEGPGADEDRQGVAFVGRAGQLLTKIIQAMGYTRDEVWIGNIVKCRPPENRNPLPEEMQACMPYLKQQLALLKPKVIVCLGSTAVKGLLEVQTGITKLRGTWMQFEGIDVMPTFHPAYLLRNPKAKRDVWEDMKDVLDKLGRPIPEKKK